MVKLRRLEKSDAPLMLEWMHDPEIQKCFQRDMMGISLMDAEYFCEVFGLKDKIENGDDMHYAIVDEKNEYLGTISLKNIDKVNSTAEYAISTRKCVQGKGVAKEATRLVLKKGFGEFGLHRIYLNVLSDNIRGIRFYEKCGFIYEGEFRKHLKVDGRHKSLKWYAILKGEFDEQKFGGGL